MNPPPHRRERKKYDANQIRYTEEAPGGEQMSNGDTLLMDKVSDRMEKLYGPVASVFHELISPRVHVDVHRIDPSEEHPYITLFTTGMAELPMHPPEGVEGCLYAELMTKLPADWPLDEESLKDERNYWPIRMLKMLARFPHEYATWLWFGHTMPHGDPPTPLAPGTKLSGLILHAPILPNGDDSSIVVDEVRTVQMLYLAPIYTEEMNLKLRKGADALYERFAKYGTTDVIDPKRRNVCSSGLSLPFFRRRT